MITADCQQTQYVLTRLARKCYCAKFDNCIFNIIIYKIIIIMFLLNGNADFYTFDHGLCYDHYMHRLFRARTGYLYYILFLKITPSGSDA